MGFLVLLPLLLIVAFGLVLGRSRQQERINRLRDRARLKVIEGRMAALRAALRIQMAEHLARRRLMAMRANDLFANSTIHEEPDGWRS